MDWMVSLYINYEKIKFSIQNPFIVCYDKVIKPQWRDFAMSEQVSVFNNDRILSWMKYFSDQTEMSVETTKLMDVSVKNKNVIPAVEANH